VRRRPNEAPTNGRSSQRSGTYDPVLAAANPTNPFAGNVPYSIEGK
jgi:hypothetical protein